MGDRSSIEWTDATWNPVTGCTKVSAGCKYCYAERVFPRVYGREYWPIDGTADEARPRRFTDVEFHPERLDQPLHWRKPRRVFVNSMSDLFHEDISDEKIYSIFQVMARSPAHQFQILTKRPNRMLRWFETVEKLPVRTRQIFLCQSWPLPNVWLGVSCEDQATADERIPLLLQTPAAVRFVSAEPLLEPIDFGQVVLPDDFFNDGAGIDWVIVGGESGPMARGMDIAWARSIVDQCQVAGVPCFVKQLGTIPYLLLKDNKGGDPEEWPEDLRVREYPV